MKLIDANELRKDFLDLPNCYNGYSDAYDKSLIIEVVDEQPTVDAEPVRHGKWVNGACNQCGSHAPYWAMAATYYRSNFCPNCGAKMDEEKENEID